MPRDGLSLATFNVKDMRRPKVHTIYFVRAANGPIKIGTTGYLDGRLKQLGTQSPVAIELLASCPGDRADEHAYHRQFAEHRLHGEWFDPHPDILAEIERLSSLAPPIVKEVVNG